MIESVLRFSVTVWYGATAQTDRDAIYRLVKTDSTSAIALNVCV